MIEARKRNVLGVGVATLMAALACTVGEAQPEPPRPADAETGAAGDTTAADVDRRAGDEDVRMGGAEEYRTTDLLVRSQLAYEAARLEESLSLAEELIATRPESMAAGPARWVGARAAFGLGRYEQARELALAYADAQPARSTMAERARELVRLADDAMAPVPAAPPLVGVVLPRSGPRVLVRYADWVLEGIELAVAEVERQQGRPIELMVVDDSGGAWTREAVRTLERRGALAIVGPLLPRQVPVAAEARRDPQLVMVSPTASRAPQWPEAYSVRTGDSRGAQELGRYAADAGFRQAALLYARGSEYERKAQAFAVEFETLGGDVRAMVPYDSGTTTFGPHMNRILEAVGSGGVLSDSVLVDSLIALGLLRDRAEADSIPADRLRQLMAVVQSRDTVPEPMDLPPVEGRAARGEPDPWRGQRRQEPFALYVAAPAQDVPKIAPQVAFYGLDSAGVQVFGDDAWATAEVRRVVPERDLQGVIAASHFPPDRADQPADPDFVALYESRYRRSLDNPLPAFGYDAANLVLQALPNRLLSPAALARRFDFLAGIRGATGMLSVRAGRVVRTPYLVQIQGGDLAPASHPWEYEMPEPIPPKPETTEEGSRR